MRYLPARPGGSGPDEHFSVTARPPHTELPAAIAALLDDRDRLAGEHAAQYAECQRLKDQSLDNRAKLDDDRLAGDAVRAGKPLPEPEAAPKLAKERHDADRRMAALADAREQVRNEILDASDVERDKLAARLPKINEAARAKADNLLAELLAVVEENVRIRAVYDWYLGEDYVARPLVEASGLPDPRTLTAPAIDVAHTVTTLVHTVMEDSHA